MDRKIVGMRLQNLRIRAHETVHQVAAIIGVSASSVMQYETGDKMPSDNVKIQIAKHFDCTVEEIFYEGFY